VTEIVRRTPVETSTARLTVSTIRVAPGYYDTVVFDDSPDKRHAGKVLPAHEVDGHRYGPYIIDKLNVRADTREEAMDDHREALYAARTEEPA
jgi:hypothetical protein